MISNSKVLAILLIAFLVPMTEILAQKSSQCLAVITGKKGSVMIKKSEQNDYSMASWGAQLFQGDRIRTGAGSQASITYPDGITTELGPGGEMAISSKTGSSEGGNVKKISSAMMVDLSTLATRKEAKTDAGVLAGLRSSSPEEMIYLSSPFNTLIKTDKPSFSWTPKKTYDRYVVNLYNSKGLVWSKKVTTPSLTFPDDQKALEPGETYFWNVEGEDLLENVKSGNLKFSVITGNKSKEVEKQEEQIRNTFWSDSDSSTYHTILGTYYRNQGLIQDAIREFQIISAIYPDASLPHEILGSLFSDTGNKDRAIEELRKALALSKTSEK